MSLASDFKEFITKGNVLDLAVAVVVGVAFNAVITAFVADVITPLIGIPGHVNFSALTYTINGSVFMIGAFVSALISFITIALVISSYSETRIQIQEKGSCNNKEMS